MSAKTQNMTHARILGDVIAESTATGTQELLKNKGRPVKYGISHDTQISLISLECGEVNTGRTL